MGNITVSAVRKFSATAVPNIFIDRYMPAANGAYVKVYLYLLRCMHGSDQGFDLSVAAEQLDETEKDIMRALNYWERQNVLVVSKDGESLTGVTFLELSSIEGDGCTEEKMFVGETPALAKAEYITPVLAIDNKQDKPEKHCYTAEELNRLCNTGEISTLFTIVQSWLGRMFTQQDMATLVYIRKDLGFSDELVLYLYEYCIGKDKKKAEYIESVAKNWHDEGIETAEQAEEYSIRYDAYFATVNKSFSLGRLPGAKEKAYLKEWSKWEMSLDLVKEACDRTINNAAKPSFAYANKILRAWHEKGFRTLKDVRIGEEKEKLIEKEKQSDKGVSRGKSAMTKSAMAYNNYPQRTYSDEELLEIERAVLFK